MLRVFQPRRPGRTADVDRSGTWLRWGLLGAGILAAGVFCGACENSILRNTAEAGLETVLETPLPTPTIAPHSKQP